MINAIARLVKATKPLLAKAWQRYRQLKAGRRLERQAGRAARNRAPGFRRVGSIRSLFNLPATAARLSPNARVLVYVLRRQSRRDEVAFCIVSTTR
jgi:hypothetical protein